ncbi:unnamed protein product [Arabidopsis halleri]
MMSYLPPDLVEEILSRVPATSLIRLRSTCKLWNTLFKHPRFTEKQFRKAPKESLVLMLKEYRVCPMNVNLNVSPPHIEFKGALALSNYPSNSEEVYIHEVFHCDGLLLCRTMDYRLVVWNPCLGETRWIQTEKKYSRLALGYEKNKSGHIYKILKCRDNMPYGQVDEFEIYDFSSDSWRVLDVVALDCFILSMIGVSLKGNTYWHALNKVKYFQFLVNFDFTAERFTRLCLPPFQNVGKKVLSVLGGKQLSLLCQRESPLNIMDIWVTNKVDTDIEAVLKWSKSFTVDIPIPSDYGPFSMSYLIDEEKKVAVCYDEKFGETSKKVYIIGEDNAYYTEIPSFEDSTNKLEWFCPTILNYVPSLAQIQGR